MQQDDRNWLEGLATFAATLATTLLTRYLLGIGNWQEDLNDLRKLADKVGWYRMEWYRWPEIKHQWKWRGIFEYAGSSREHGVYRGRTIGNDRLDSSVESSPGMEE